MKVDEYAIFTVGCFHTSCEVFCLTCLKKMLFFHWDLGKEGHPKTAFVCFIWMNDMTVTNNLGFPETFGDWNHLFVLSRNTFPNMTQGKSWEIHPRHNKSFCISEVTKKSRKIWAPIFVCCHFSRGKYISLTFDAAQRRCRLAEVWECAFAPHPRPEALLWSKNPCQCASNVPVHAGRTHKLWRQQSKWKGSSCKPPSWRLHELQSVRCAWRVWTLLRCAARHGACKFWLQEVAPGVLQVLWVEVAQQWVCIRQDGRWCLRPTHGAWAANLQWPEILEELRRRYCSRNFATLYLTLRDARVSKPSDWASQLSSTVSSSSPYDLGMAVVEPCPSPRLYVDGFFCPEIRRTACLGSIGIYTAQLYRFQISLWEGCFFSWLNWLNFNWSKMYISKS